MPEKIACIILAAGKGTRMKSTLPKPLHPVAGRPMVQHVIAAAQALSPEKIVVVTGNDMPAMEDAVRPCTLAVQHVPNGTGSAALAAKPALENFSGDILVLFGDTPLVTTDTLRRMVEARRQTPATGLVYAALRMEDPTGYGRMVPDEDGTLARIVEHKDATAAEKEITLCNGGILCADGARLFDWLEHIGNDNAQGEYYLTDLPPVARKDNRTTHIVEVPAIEMEGANTRVQLARLEKLMQQRLREKHMLNGATLVDPETVFFAHDTVLGRDVVIEPNVVFGTGVHIADNVTIRAFSHIEGADIAQGAVIGPFARLRPDSTIGANARIGNFVEVKNSHIAAEAKANHLAYLGDAAIGTASNIGAGTITCNYDGFMKHKTAVGKNVLVGSNTALVAPVNIGDNAIIAAGSTINADVPANALGITRAPQITKDGWAVEYRQNKIRQKNDTRKRDK